jgi:hypothetical protein
MQSLDTLRMIKSQSSQLNFLRRTALLVRIAHQAGLASTRVEATYITKTSTHDSLQSPIPHHQSNKEVLLCRLHSPQAPHTVCTMYPLRRQDHMKISQGRGRQPRARRAISHRSASEA